jgi:hypothetical protein
MMVPIRRYYHQLRDAALTDPVFLDNLHASQLWGNGSNDIVTLIYFHFGTKAVEKEKSQ